MSYFVDTNIFVAALNEKDSDHTIGKVLLQGAFERSDWLYTTDYILDECISLAWSKTRKENLAFRISLVKKLDDVIQGSEKIRLTKVDEHDFTTAKSYLRKHTEVIASLTDWTSLIVMRNHNVPNIISLDRDFKDVKKLDEFKWVHRINDPMDLVDPKDPIFNMRTVPGTGRKERTSIEHDKILYGEFSE